MGLASPARAQAPAPASAPTWEIGGHVGLSLVRPPADGRTSFPAAGPAITTSSPTFPSRRTSSWFFGDGAAMFNDATTDFGLTDQITPLDEALASLGFAKSTQATLGFRVARSLTRRWSAEAAVDVMPASLKLSDAFTSAVGSTRESFGSAFSTLLASGPFTAVIVETSGGTTTGSSREIAVTGSAALRFAPRGAYVPFATFGGGVLTRTGTLPSVSLEGRYRFIVTAGDARPISIDETDRVTIRYAQDPELVAVIGGGLYRDMSNRWGLRLSGRLLIGRPKLRVLLDADPARTLGTPGYIEMFSYPNLQFSGNPSSGRESTLSGDPLDGFVAVKSTGVDTRILITVDVFFRLRQS